MKNLTILYVEDEDGIRESLAEFINNFADNVFVAKDGQEGLNLYLKEKIDIVISDIKMPIMSGIDMAYQIKRLNQEPHIIFTTAHSDSEYMSEAIDMQVDGYILKPIDFDKLENTLNHIIEFINLNHELSIHKISHPTMNLENTMSATLGNNQDILYANDEFLSFFNIKNINKFYSKYESFSSIFIKENGCFYPREHENWINDFRRIKKNARRFIALFDETNDNLQIAVGHVYDMNDGLSVGITLKKVDSLDYFNKTNDEHNSLECMTIESKESLKKLFKEKLEKNEHSSIKIINILINSDDIEVLDELSIKINNNIRHTDLFKKCDINYFYVIVMNTFSENAVKIVDRLEYELLNKSLKGEINIINIDSEEAIDRAFVLKTK